jgi:outer membrane protein TolC
MTLVGTSRRAGPLLLVAMLAACATAGHVPLPSAPETKASFSVLKVDPALLRVEPLKPVVVDARDGLDPTEVAVLAVLNSPDLRAKRAAAGVSRAQVFAAGLLPDPTIDLSADFPITPGAAVAYTAALTLDVQALLTRSASLAAARASARQADLDLLWAEWGTAQQARQLAQTAVTDEARAAALRRVLAEAGDRAARTQAAMARGDVAAQTAGADLATQLDAQAQLNSAEHDAAKARRDLNALLDLKPDVRLPLVPEAGAQPTYDEAALAAAEGALATRRPDLLALQAGYAAQDANLRKAVLAQFPLLNVSGNHARDNSDISSNGAGASFALPIFNGGRGQIAVEKATREQLRAEYQARLDQTEAEVAGDRAELAAALKQVGELEASVPRLEAMAAGSEPAYARGDIDSATHLALVQAALNRRADLEDKRLAASQAEAALETALFLPPAGLRLAR